MSAAEHADSVRHTTSATGDDRSAADRVLLVAEQTARRAYSLAAKVSESLPSASLSTSVPSATA